MTDHASRSALSDVQRLLDALERAKSEVPGYSVEALVFVRAEIKVIRRRVENIRRAIGDPVQ